MNISIIQGKFSASEAENLISQMIQVKIKYHENKIGASGDNTEDIKMGEKRIIQLQKQLSDFRTYISQHEGKISLYADLKIAED